MLPNNLSQGGNHPGYRSDSEERKPERITPGHPLSGKRVLVVEDDPFFRTFIRMVFRSWNLSADLCENGKMAIERLKKKYYDIVVTDLEMPVMDGWETARFIRTQLKREIPVIAVTGNLDDHSRQKALECGINDTIFKPVDPSLLFATILHHLSHVGKR